MYGVAMQAGAVVSSVLWNRMPRASALAEWLSPRRFASSYALLLDMEAFPENC